MILDKKVITKWSGRMRSYYESFGYIFTGKCKEFEVLVEHLPKNSAVRVKAVCDTCGKIRSLEYYAYKPNCSECTSRNNILKYNEENIELLRERMSRIGKYYAGERHNRWNPDRAYKEREYHRGKPEYIEWAKNVKIRDNFKCVICSSSKSNCLVSHHLMSYLHYPELRYDLNNGVCLCKNCHYSFHGKYGNKHNTKEQFEEFKFIKHFESFIN